MDEAICEDIEGRVRGILEEVSEETGVGLRMELEQVTPGGQVPGAETSRPSSKRCPEISTSLVSAVPSMCHPDCFHARVRPSGSTYLRTSWTVLGSTGYERHSRPADWGIPKFARPILRTSGSLKATPPF